MKEVSISRRVWVSRGGEWLVELSVIHRSPALLIPVLIKDLCALAPGLIVVTSCFIGMSYLCFREGMIRRELEVCLALSAAIFLPFRYTLFSNTKHQVWRHGRISLEEGRTVESPAASVAVRAHAHTHGITGASSVCRIWRNWPFVCGVMGFVQYENLSNGYMQWLYIRVHEERLLHTV